MGPTKRLTAVVSKLSTVRMLDELSLQLSAYAPLQGPFWDKGSAGWAPRHILVLVGFEGFTLSPCC
jgi:hypothetical protein